jgi:hypothetical protein
VVEAERAALVGGLERVQEVERLLADVLLRPGRRDGGVHRELLDVELARDHEVMVPDEAEVSRLLGECDAFVGLSPVADEVAEAPAGIHALLGDVRQHGLERRQIAVDVAEERDPHGRNPDAL